MEENPQKLDEYHQLFVEVQMQIHSKKSPLVNKLSAKLNRKIAQTGNL